LEASLMDAENCLETLLKIFRDTNHIHRGGRQNPAYFDTRPRLQPLMLPDFGADDDREVLAKQERLVESLAAAVDKARANIQAAFNTQAERLKPLDAHVRLAVSK